MKKIEITAYGAPEDNAHCVDAPALGTPGPGEVNFDVLAFPINPADLSFCRGNYRLQPTLPATPGAECVGRVTAVGAGVTALKPGDLVINMQRENWAAGRRVKAQDAVPIPAGLDIAQAAMLRINPPTAQLLLEDHVALNRGDWVIQDVANSAVGRHLIVLAHARGIHTINVVRRGDVGDLLRGLGGDVVIEDGPDLAERAGKAAGGASIRLGIDAISGEATRRIMQCVADEGVVVNYGGLSNQDPQIDRPSLGVRGVSLMGFMLGRGLAKRSPEAVRTLYAELANQLRDRRLQAPIDSFYPIEQIKEALIHAQRAGRNGKILVLPNGPI